MARFKPFPGEEDLVSPAGSVYRCRGCGGDVLDGQLIFATVKDGRVIGIRAMPGQPGPGVPTTHECGTPDEMRD